MSTEDFDDDQEDEDGQMPDMDEVELHPAYFWDCPECGTENFERGVLVEMDDEKLTQFKEDNEIDPDEEGCLILSPSLVQCCECGCAYRALHHGITPDDFNKPEDE